jgi:malate synthase
VVPLPKSDLVDRRVEITGPVDRKMIINALNSGASVYMADFEDSHCPTWEGTVQGQINLFDAVRRRIEYTSPEGKRYRLNDRTSTLMVRPRGWHLEEKHVVFAGAPFPASLFDFGLFFYHNVQELLRRGTGPYFYLPKLEHYAEAVLWDDVFRFAEDALGLARGAIRATVLIETLPAVFEMDEILWALREHSAGLNCGRWDYIFSFIKQFREDPIAVFPDRSLLPMSTPFLTAYSRLLVQTCHRRGAHAIGGMAAQIPIKGDPNRNSAAIAKVRADKEREIDNGHDGTWVAHPGLVPVVFEVFQARMQGPNQISAHREPLAIGAEELLAVPHGERSREGAQTNVHVALRYLDSWFQGTGSVAVDHLMEDSATVEIARAQLWQWIRHSAQLKSGERFSAALFRQLLREETQRYVRESGQPGPRTSLSRSVDLLDKIVTDSEFVEFFTLPAYEALDETVEVAAQ